MSTYVPGAGPLDADGMLIGEAPGAEEEKVGKPFVGKSGQRLNKALTQAGLDRDELYITNVVKERPKNNRTPTPTEIAAQRRTIYDEIELVRPKLILLLGSVATQCVLLEPIGKLINSGIGWVVGKYLGQGWSVPVRFTYHPAYTFYNPDSLEEFYRDVQTFADHLLALRAETKERELVP